MVSNTSDSYSDSDDSFIVCEIQKHTAARLYADLSVPTRVHSKSLHLRWRLDPAADFNVMPVSVYKKLFHDKSMSRFGPAQACLGVYNSNNKTLIGSCVLHHKSETLAFTITYLEGSVLLNHSDTHLLSLFQATDKLNKKLSNGAKLITNQINRYEVHTTNKKTDNIPALGNQSQSNTSTQIVHTKQNLMKLFPYCL